MFWYRAIIVSNPPTKPTSRIRESCVRLLKDGFSTPLTELTRQASFRPVQPKRGHIPIGIGSIVGADHEGGWWTGTVVKEIDDDNCLVLFDSPPDIIRFERKHLRLHFDWKGKSWDILNKDSQFLRNLKEEEPKFNPGTMVEVSCKINISEVVWRPAMIIKEIEEDDEAEEVEEEDETEEDDEIEEIEKESLKVENERKILELQRLNKEAEKEIAESKLCAATIVQQLEDVELLFQTAASAPW